MDHVLDCAKMTYSIYAGCLWWAFVMEISPYKRKIWFRKPLAKQPTCLKVIRECGLSMKNSRSIIHWRKLLRPMHILLMYLSGSFLSDSHHGGYWGLIDNKHVFQPIIVIWLRRSFIAVWWACKRFYPILSHPFCVLITAACLPFRHLAFSPQWKNFIGTGKKGAPAEKKKQRN